MPRRLCPTASGPTPLSGFGGVTSDPWSFSIGAYDLSEIGPAGYSHGDWVCVGTGTQDDGDTVRLGLGESLACTLTNDDVPPPRLTLIKLVVNDSGGTALAIHFTLTATGPASFSGSGPAASSTPGFQSGTY